MFNRNPMFPNFNNPYSVASKPGFNWGNLLNNTQKTLSIINQAIPVFYQIKPIWNNARTMFRVMGEMGKLNNNSRSSPPRNVGSTTASSQTNQPNFRNNEPNFFI